MTDNPYIGESKEAEDWDRGYMDSRWKYEYQTQM